MRLFLLVLAVLIATQAAEAASTQVTISVPPVQVLEGATTLVVSAEAQTYRAQLLVKSNTAWTLVARLSGNLSRANWRSVNSGSTSDSWIRLEDAAPVLRGQRGVHLITYEVRVQNGQAGVLTFALGTD